MNRKLLYEKLQQIHNIKPQEEIIKLITTNSELFFQKNIYENIVLTLKEIEKKKNNNIEDSINFLKGIIQVSPYNKNRFIEEVRKDNKLKFTNTTSTINDLLKTEFMKKDIEMYHKLTRFDFKQEHEGYITKRSKDPQEIQKIVKKTNACINDDPLNFFHQIANDIGTIYLLTYPKEFDNRIDELDNRNAKVSYSRLYILQNKKRNEKIIGVDNIWFNNQDKKIINHVLNELNVIGNHFNMKVIDEAITKTYIKEKGNELDIYIPEEKFFKIGNIPLITRYIGYKVNTENGFYLLNK